MGETVDNMTDFSAPTMIEGIAQVVAVDGNMAWLVPESGTSCGGCSSAAACGSKGIGTVASRLEARRFQLVNDAGLRVGERVVLGIRENALLRASITAYVIPLATLLIAGALAQWVAGSDTVTMAAMLAGLVLGLWFARLRAGRLMAKGELAPRFIRRASAGETCNS
ncbi:MAG: Fis family transcriptional regulator [Gallionellales bacterium RIFCSPLOWO2_02_FULL_57_47]|nr:MAG: Fis family transcriptional regulator [Gallionellales bacterium RIFCSPLOWO2_02_FULL_57_47]OGT09123.1 MAG: Fis family transcriptional regulator [Gallionellales bacterium RIFCSPHIGHO2_02_FULL_57_16]